MTEEIQITEEHVLAMRAEFERYLVRGGQDKIPVTKVRQVTNVLGQDLTDVELKNIETEGNDGAGRIDFQNLLALIALQLQARQGIRFYRTVFDMIDTTGQGYLSFQQLRSLIYKLQELTPEMQLSDSDVDELVNTVKQSNKTNRVTFEDFYRLMAE